MPYIQESDVDHVFDQDRLDEAFDVDKSGTPDATAVAKLIEWADDQVYGWIGTKFPSLTPASFTAANAPPQLNRISAVVCAWMAVARASKYLTKTYDEAKAEAIAIGKGERQLRGKVREDLPESIRRESLRETRDADSVIAEHGEPSPNTTGDPLKDNTYRATF